MIRTKQDAMNALSEVPMENHFWLCDGAVLKNLGGLLKTMRRMKKDIYDYHVSQEKNDFSNWIRNIMGDTKLAGDLSKAKNKRQAVIALNERVKWLKKKSKK